MHIDSHKPGDSISNGNATETEWLQQDFSIGELFMYFKPFRDPLYKVSFLSLHRQVLRFAECLEVIYRQLSPLVSKHLNHFTTNVP